MIGIIIISENRSAAEMLKTAKRVLDVRVLKNVIPLTIKSNFSRQTLLSKINRAINRLNAPNGILIFSELYGSTQSNVCREFLHPEEIELVCGYNLSMLIKALTHNQHSTLPDLVDKVTEAGRKYIRSYCK